MREILGPAAPREHEPCLEERQIETRAVEGHDAGRPCEEGPEGRQERRLVVEVAHEVLRQHEPVALEPARADEKGAGAGAAREPRRRGVEEEEPARVTGRRLCARQRAQEAEGRLEGRAQRVAAVAMGERELPADDEDLTLARVVELAAEYFVG